MRVGMLRWLTQMPLQMRYELRGLLLSAGTPLLLLLLLLSGLLLLLLCLLLLLLHSQHLLPHALLIYRLLLRTQR